MSRQVDTLGVVWGHGAVGNIKAMAVANGEWMISDYNDVPHLIFIRNT
jgi:hypothetical protein